MANNTLSLSAVRLVLALVSYVVVKYIQVTIT